MQGCHASPLPIKTNKNTALKQDKANNSYKTNNFTGHRRYTPPIPNKSIDVLTPRKRRTVSERWMPKKMSACIGPMNGLDASRNAISTVMATPPSKVYKATLTCSELEASLVSTSVKVCKTPITCAEVEALPCARRSSSPAQSSSSSGYGSCDQLSDISNDTCRMNASSFGFVCDELLSDDCGVSVSSSPGSDDSGDEFCGFNFIDATLIASSIFAPSRSSSPNRIFESPTALLETKFAPSRSSSPNHIFESSTALFETKFAPSTSSSPNRVSESSTGLLETKFAPSRSSSPNRVSDESSTHMLESKFITAQRSSPNLVSESSNKLYEHNKLTLFGEIDAKEIPFNLCLNLNTDEPANNIVNLNDSDANLSITSLDISDLDATKITPSENLIKKFVELEVSQNPGRTSHKSLLSGLHLKRQAFKPRGAKKSNLNQALANKKGNSSTKLKYYKKVSAPNKTKIIAMPLVAVPTPVPGSLPPPPRAWIKDIDCSEKKTVNIVPTVVKMHRSNDKDVPTLMQTIRAKTPSQLTHSGILKCMSPPMQWTEVDDAPLSTFTKNVETFPPFFQSSNV